MDSLADEIERFLLATGLSATRLGVLALNDSAFVHSIRAGREPRRKTVRRVRSFMARHVRDKAELATVPP